ncbi:hypothetical protein C0995_014783 [Termitomyces sp. Mi166|nr:hypothetical protein C0995_014783 [Termitomyces sp. Mi166\
MSLDTEMHRRRSQHARQTSRSLLSNPASAQFHGLPTSRSRSLKRKKSSDSASTGTAVTASEDTHGSAAKLHDQAVSSGSRLFIAPRRSRPKREDHRSSRSDREPLSREAGRRSIHASNGGPSKRENPPDIIAVAQNRRDKGKTVDWSAHSPPIRRPLPEPPTSAGSERCDKNAYCGPLAHAEFERMKKEIDFWKKAATDNKKQAKQQSKRVEELRSQVLAETLAKNEQETQVQTLKANIEKKEELIASIETSLQCQICMDLIHRPYALSPCGHILCLHCLQEWFRKAPPAPEDNDADPDEFGSNYILNRVKSCPCCRAVITQRPIPVFVVKAIATALSKHRATVEPGASIRNRTPSPTIEDPWKGLFYSTDDDDVDSIEASDEDEVYGDTIGWAVHGLQMGFRGELGHQLLEALEDVESETGSEFEGDEGLDMEEEEDIDDDGDGDGDSVNSYEFEQYESDYVPARWEPPSVVVDPEMYVFRNQGVAASILRMLRRGCTVDMIRLFEITYSHDQGLVAHLPSLDDDFVELSHVVVPRNNRVFLGWNVHLDGEDYTGELYMRRVLTDTREHPEKWLWTERTYFPGAFDVKLTVRIEEVEHYDTTDTEDWLAPDPYD